MAFNSKNLHYNKQEPAFLRRLKGEYGGQDGRQNYQAPRPKRDRLKAGDEDDDPVIVDEQGETVGKEEFERRMRGDAGEAPEDRGGATTPKEGNHGGGTGDEELEVPAVKGGERQKVTEIAGSAATKKRKVGKVVGGDEDLEDAAQDVSRSASATKGKDDKAVVPTSKESTMAKKKKGKKIKLSFDEPNG